MAFKGIKLDPDDPFDKIVFTEEHLIQNGFDEGFTNGKKSGEIDGFQTGAVQGKELSREIGFYKGFVAVLGLMMSGGADEQWREKQRKLVEQLDGLLDNFTYNEEQYDQMQSTLALIRSKFKQISSVFKLPVTIQKQQEGMSF